MDKARPSPLLAIVGGGSLLGREVRDVLADAALPVRAKLIGTDESEIGTLTEQGGEAIIMTALDEDNLAAARVVVLAGSGASSRKTLEILARCARQPAVVDLTHTFEHHPNARLRAPLAEPPDHTVPPETLHVIAHPAAIVLALFYARLADAFPFRRSIAHVFEPASERGHPGINELKDQTVNLLTFKRWPKAVFDEQLGFNLLARYGSDAPESLQRFEARIERDLASLLALWGGLPIPSLRLVQAPVFHGHSFSVWVEFESNPGAPALEQALASAHIDVRDSTLDAPTNVGYAGQNGIAVGAISADASDPRACWFWGVADNLRIVAENAVAVARSFLAEPAP